jgi:hypothetical protein
MNTPTPTPTPRTDTATYPADCLGATLVTNRDCSRALETELTALTAERDELRVALALGQENCDAPYDELRGDCDELRADVVRLTAERDQLRAALALGQINFDNAYDDLRTERGKLRAELAELHDSFAGNVHTRCNELRAELATERARLDWVFGNCKVTADDFTTGNRDVYAIHDREDLGAAMKEGAK